MDFILNLALFLLIAASMLWPLWREVREELWPGYNERLRQARILKRMCLRPGAFGQRKRWWG